jgi:phosphoglycolate phosphatase-like HAD superfamily hydrolase
LKLIVWDFDGTLADSRPLIVAGMEHALHGLNLQDLPGIRQAWLAQVGLPVEEGLRRTFASTNVDPAEVLKVYRTFDWLGHEHLLRPFSGMSELIHELHGLNVRMAIASSKRTVPLRRQVQVFGWEECFDLLVTPDDVQDGKPHPESLEICLKTYDLAPSEALMIGDTPFDLEMAKRAGVPSVAVGHGFYDRESLLEWEPYAYAEDVPALRKILLALVTP